MKRNHRISIITSFIIIVLSNFSSLAANAQDYYVDAVNGSDKWTGTAQECSGCDPNTAGLAGPWKTLYQVFSFSNAPRFNPGDQILLKRGQDHLGGDGDTNPYGSFVPHFLSSGDENQPIAFGAYGEIEYDAAGEETNKPIVRVRVTKIAPPAVWNTTDTPGVWVLSKETFSTEYLWEDDRPLKKASSLDCLKGIGSNCPDGNWFHYDELCSGCDHTDTPHYRPTSGTPNDHTVHYGRWGVMIFRDVSHMVFRDLNFRTSTIPINFRAVNAATNDITVENCIFYGVLSGPWIDATNFDVSGLYVRHNKFLYTMRSVTNNGQGSPPHNIFDGEIAYNESRNTNGFDFWTGDQEHYYVQNMNRFHVHHNTIIGGRTAGMPGWYASGRGGTSHGNIIEHNLIMNLHGKDGFVARGWSHGAGPYYDDCYNNVVRYNVIINNDVGMVPIGCFVSSQPANQIYNNTLIGNGINIWGRAQMRTWVIKNNLSLNPMPTAAEPRGLHFWYENALPLSVYPYPYTGDNNLYYPDGPALFMVGSYAYDFAGWKTKTGQDGNSFVADPLLANLVDGDFHLTHNSPAIDRGVSYGLLADFDGKSVLGATDIGAYEFGTRATADVPVLGTVSGTHETTHVADNTYQTLTEVNAGGNNSSRLEHQWLFDISGGGNLSFSVEAHHTPNIEGDDFIFAYSTDGVAFTDMLTVTKTADDDAVQTFPLPPLVGNNLYVRVRDANRSVHSLLLDSLYVDQLYVQSQ